ncbi:MAG: DsrE family protein [Methanosarcinales archaeon]
MTKKIIVIVTQPPYGKEEAYGAIPLASAQTAVDNEASVIFVSGGVHSVVKGQQTGYGSPAVWKKDVPSIENEIKEHLDMVNFYVVDSYLKKRGISDNEIIDGVKKITLSDLTDKILESDVTLVF